MDMTTPEFGRVGEDYRRHRAGFPDSFFDRLEALGLPLADQRILDLGTGTGTLARGFAERGARVVGLDPDAAMLAQARRMAEEAGIPADAGIRPAPGCLTLIEKKAEATDLPDQSFDLVSAGQCWHWFSRVAAAREAARILAPGGHILIAHLDWIPLPRNIVAACEALITRHNPDWMLGGGSGVYPKWFKDLGQAGFQGLESFTFDLDLAYTPEAWRGRLRASAGIGATLAPDKVEAFDRDVAALLDREFPGPEVHVPHRVFTLIGQRPRTLQDEMGDRGT